MKVGEVYVMYLKIRVQYLIFTSYPLEKKSLKYGLCSFMMIFKIIQCSTAFSNANWVISHNPDFTARVLDVYQTHKMVINLI